MPTPAVRRALAAERATGRRSGWAAQWSMAAPAESDRFDIPVKEQ
jgi:hypothetical protein